MLLLLLNDKIFAWQNIRISTLLVINRYVFMLVKRYFLPGETVSFNVRYFYYHQVLGTKVGGDIWLVAAKRDASKGPH